MHSFLSETYFVTVTSENELGGGHITLQAALLLNNQQQEKSVDLTVPYYGAKVTQALALDSTLNHQFGFEFITVLIKNVRIAGTDCKAAGSIITSSQRKHHPWGPFTFTLLPIDNPIPAPKGYYVYSYGFGVGNTINITIGCKKM